MNKLFSITGTILIFFWFSSFIFINLFFDFFGRMVEFFIILYSFLVIYIYRLWNDRLNKKALVLFILFFALIFYSMLRDYIFGWYNLYFNELYIKTIYYSSIAFLFSYTFYKVLYRNDKLINISLKIFANLSCLFVFIFFFYFYYSGWSVGTSMIYMDFGEHYQGVSRVFGLYFIFLFFLKDCLNFLLFYLSIILCLILIFSFNSFGVFFALLVVIFYLIKNFLNMKGMVIFTFSALIFFYFLDYINLFNLDLFLDLNDRAMGKIDGGENQDSRSWLFLKSYELWISNIWNFLFGSGPIQYACYVGYCESYRHPHNSIMLLINWFGFFSIPYIFILLYSFFLILKNYIISDSKDVILFSSLTLYYLLLSLIGGDIEQNRFLLFLIPLFLYFSKKSFIKI